MLEFLCCCIQCSLQISWFSLKGFAFYIMSRLSEIEWSDSSTSESSDTSSGVSEDVFVSANEDFEATQDTPELSDGVLDYSECVEVVEPIATQEEAETYAENLAREEEEEETLWSRFSGEENVENW